MNYRQWKKKYKKEHGYNPPLEEDKRKQAKLVRRVLHQIRGTEVSELIAETATRATQVITEAAERIIEALPEFVDKVAAAVNELAEILGESEGNA